MRHVYLLALRDAERELASAGGDRVRMILHRPLGDDEQIDAFMERIGSALKNVATDPNVVKVGEKIKEPLQDLTVPDVPSFQSSQCRTEADAGRACMTMGLMRVQASDGVVVWGKTGSRPGYTSGAFATRDLSRKII